MSGYEITEWVAFAAILLAPALLGMLDNKPAEKKKMYVADRCGYCGRRNIARTDECAGCGAAL